MALCCAVCRSNDGVGPSSAGADEAGREIEASLLVFLRQNMPQPSSWKYSLRSLDFARPLKEHEEILLRWFMEKHVLREMSDYSTLQIMNIPDAHWFWHSIRMYWVRSAFTDCGMLSSIFLITCRYIAKVYREPSLMYYILKYKSDCLGHLRIAVKSEIQRGVSNLTITKTLLLALDETFAKSYGEEATGCHSQSAAEMLRTRGHSVPGSSVGTSLDGEGGRFGNAVISFNMKPSVGMKSEFLGTVRWGASSAEIETATRRGYIYHAFNLDI